MSNLSTNQTGGTPTIKILLVDPVPDSLEHLKRLLNAVQDFEVIETAYHGLEALRKARQLQADIVIMDMDVLDGLNAVARITKTLPATGVIVTSASPDPDHREQIRLFGARNLLVKLLNVDWLYSTVRDVYKQYEPIVIRDYWPSKLKHL